MAGYDDAHIQYVHYTVIHMTMKLVSHYKMLFTFVFQLLIEAFNRLIVISVIAAILCNCMYGQLSMLKWRST